LATIAGAVAAAVAGGLSGREAFGIALLLGLSISGMLAGLLLAKRTDPAILYKRILDRAPEAPSRIPREGQRETARRTLGPAAGVALTLVAVSPIGIAILLLVLGEPRRELLDHLPAAALLVGGVWTFVAGIAALRMAHYFARWERAKGRTVLCRPQRAGLMRHVYFVAED
jgi:uncharacterized membrane protein